MEDDTARILDYSKETDTRKEVGESQKDNPNIYPGALEKALNIHTGDIKGGDNAPKGGVEGLYGEINMEAAVSSDDVTRAGGFGARDDIGSCLPVASDSTDFEASLLDARGYEEPQKEVDRPGLGYTKDREGDQRYGTLEP